MRIPIHDSTPKKLIAIAPLVLALMSCMHKASVPVASTPVTDKSFLDLAPGGSLRIVVPHLKSGALPPTTQPLQQEGNAFIVSAANLAGYDVSHYSVERAAHGHVRLKFITAEITRDSNTFSVPDAPALPFALPLTPQHIRLIYLIRVSQSDHNMAIVAAKDFEALNTFTKQLENHPDVCGKDAEIFCSWVPSGVAVRPESQPAPKPR